MNTLFENNRIRIYMDVPYGDVFIEDKEYEGVKVRVGTTTGGLLITADPARLIPWAYNGSSAILVRK